jgi:hypothetical protein
MVLYALADLHNVFLELLEPAGKIAVDHRLTQRLINRDDHRRVLARWIGGLVVLRLDIAA